MDVLFLAHRAPFPPDKGDRLRAYRHIERLARLGPVDVVAQADDEAAARAARPGLEAICREVHIVTRRRLSALLHVGWSSVCPGRSLTAGWHADSRVRHAIEDLQQRHDYGLCWAFSSGTGPWWRSVRASTRVMDLCDLDALKWEALGRDEPGLMGWVYRLEGRRLLPLELELAAEADLALVSTAQEAGDLHERGGTPRRLELLTNGVDWRRFEHLPPPSAAGPVVAFLGQMDYPPNVRAVRHLAEEVMPVVRRSIPDAVLRIMGRAPSPEVMALAAPGQVEVTGEVPDVAVALGGARVFVAPLDTGRGIPNKIIEALAAGRATVVSSWSAHALNGRPGEDYLVADGVTDRARVVAELLSDAARCDRLGAAGRTYVRRHHDWDAVLDRLTALVEDVAGA